MLVVFVVALFAINMVQAASAEIPDSIKNRIGQWITGKNPDGGFAQALLDLSQSGLIGEKISQNSYMPPSYGQIMFVKITGRSTEYSQTSPVHLTVTDPDGIKSEYTTPVLESGTYYTLIPIEHDAKLGKYHVTAYHVGKRLPDSIFYVGYPNARIPEWITYLASWWIDEKITDAEFLHSIEFLLKNKVIEFAGSADSVFLNISVEGAKTVRRGTMQNITILVTDAHGPVDGATIFIRIEDYGENVFEEFKGITDDTGKFQVSWEINSDFSNLKTLLAYIDVTNGVSSGSKVFTFEVYCLCGESNCKCRT